MWFQFDKETCKELDGIQGRLLVIACDGRNGQASRLLGLDEFSEQHSCNAYGAIAAIERTEARDVPTPEKRVHNLTFDLSAYGAYHSDNDCSPGFSLKVFGNSKHRFISLAISKCESSVVKALRTILDRSVSVDYRWSARDGVVIGRHDLTLCPYVWLFMYVFVWSLYFFRVVTFQKKKWLICIDI